MTPALRWVLALLSAAFLALCLQPFLGRAPGPACWILEAPVERHPDALAAQVWVESAVADGQRIDLAGSVLRGTWVRQPWGFGQEGGPPGALRLCGRQLTLTLLRSRWCGTARLRPPSGPALALDQFGADAECAARVVELVGAELAPDWDRARLRWLPVRWGLALIPCALLLWWIRPWRSDRRITRWVLGHLVLVHLLAWLTQPIGSNADVAGYLGSMTEIRSGNPAYFPPGYPLFLTLGSALWPGLPGHGLALLQHLLMLLSLWWIHGLVRAFLPPGPALVGLLLAGSVAPTMFLPQALLSETLALSTMAGTLAGAHAAARCARPLVRGLLELGAGVLLGIATWTRVTPIVVLAAPLLLVTRGIGGARTALARTARILAVALVVLAVALAWFWHHSGQATLTTSAARHLFNRVVNEQRLVDRDGTATRRYLALLADSPAPFAPHWTVMPELLAKGLSHAEAQDLLGAVASEGLRTAPLAFLRHTARMAWDEYGTSPMTLVPAGPTDQTPAALEAPALLPVPAAARAWRTEQDLAFAQLWPWLRWLPLVAALVLSRAPGRAVLLALLLVTAGYLIGCALGEHRLARYVAAVLPFALFLVPAPFAWLLAARRRVSTGPPPPATTGSG